MRAYEHAVGNPDERSTAVGRPRSTAASSALSTGVQHLPARFLVSAAQQAVLSNQALQRQVAPRRKKTPRLEDENGELRRQLEAMRKVHDSRKRRDRNVELFPAPPASSHQTVGICQQAFLLL